LFLGGSALFYQRKKKKRKRKRKEKLLLFKNWVKLFIMGDFLTFFWNEKRKKKSSII